MSWSRILGSATLMAFVLSLGVGSVESAIPNPTNKKFYACMKKRTGTVRLINYPKKSKCARGWKLINWNAKGNPGAAGPAGPAGPAGAAGAAGSAGPAGPAGITKIRLTVASGATTATGAVGTTGETYATCPAGKVTGGGFTQTSDRLRITMSAHSGTNQWVVGWTKLGASDTGLWVWAICMTTEPGAVIARLSPAAKTAIKKAKKKRR